AAGPQEFCYRMAGWMPRTRIGCRDASPFYNTICPHQALDSQPAAVPAAGSSERSGMKVSSTGRAHEFDGGPPRCYHRTAGWSSLVARWAHNPKVGGSNPPPATNPKLHKT